MTPGLTWTAVELVRLPNIAGTKLDPLTNWRARTAGFGSNGLVFISLREGALGVVHDGTVVIGLTQRVHLARVHFLEVEVLAVYDV